MTIRYLICAAALLVLGISHSHADTENDTDSLFHRDTLTGDWLGARKDLADAGIQIGGDEIFDALANPVGGHKQGATFEGRLELFTNIDLGPAAGWKGALFHANAYLIHGNGLSYDDVGNLLTIGNIGTTPGTRLFSAWLQQSFLDGALSIRAGQIAADDEFFVSQYAGLFINSTFGWPSILGINLPSGGPAYPLATPGLRIRYAVSPSLIVSTGVFNGDPAPQGPGNPQLRDAAGTNFRLDGGLFWIGELAYSASIAMNQDSLPGTYKLGGWVHDGAFADQRFDTTGRSLADPASSDLPALHHGDYGGYVIADQLLWRAEGNSDRGLGIFFRAGGDPADRNLITFHLDGGLTYAGLLPGRDNDVLGIGMSYEQVSAAQRHLTGDLRNYTSVPHLPDFESALELSYQAQLAPWCVVQPDAQFIIHPGARLPNPTDPSGRALRNALVLGMRTAVSL
ncbi:MAG: carbohydrate porin [Rhizomicrobium sp.]